MVGESSGRTRKSLNVLSVIVFNHFAYYCPHKHVIDEIHNENLDECGIDEEAYEPHGNFSEI